MHLRRVLLAVPLACAPSPSDPPDAASTTELATSSSPPTATTDAPTSTAATTTDSTTSDDATADLTTAAPTEELPPIDSVEILEAWLATGAYKSWAVESAVHASTGPHAGNVLTYVNALALQSLAAGAAEHPQDAATVKELYGDSFDTILGYAVSRKTTSQSEGGATWYWYERVEATTYGGELGTSLCAGCHGGGADYILTPYPLQ